MPQDMEWIDYLEPRDRAEAKRAAVILTVVAAGVTLLFTLAVPPSGGDRARLATYLVPVFLLAVSAAFHLAPQGRRLLVLWTLLPVLGIVVIAGLDLATRDASAAGQVFLCYPVIYAASQLKAPTAVAATALAIVADAVVVFSLEPFASAVTDFAYVSAVLIAMTALLVRAGERNDALVTELRHQAAVDSLTGLVTRRVLDDALERALAVDSSERGTALVMLDIDRFKAVNDAHGHPVGDAALRHIAAVLAAHTRSDTVICRLGGDEIAFLMPGVSRPVALQRAEDLVLRVRSSPLPLTEGRILALSVSAGVAHAPEDATTITELYAKADAALYNAKHAGRDRVGVPGPVVGRPAA